MDWFVRLNYRAAAVVCCRRLVEDAVSTLLHSSAAGHLSLVVQISTPRGVCGISMHSFRNVTTGARCHGLVCCYSSLVDVNSLIKNYIHNVIFLHNKLYTVCKAALILK